MLTGEQFATYLLGLTNAGKIKWTFRGPTNLVAIPKVGGSRPCRIDLVWGHGVDDPQYLFVEGGGRERSEPRGLSAVPVLHSPAIDCSILSSLIVAAMDSAANDELKWLDGLIGDAVRKDKEESTRYRPRPDYEGAVKAIVERLSVTRDGSDLYNDGYREAEQGIINILDKFKLVPDDWVRTSGAKNGE